MKTNLRIFSSVEFGDVNHRAFPKRSGLFEEGGGGIGEHSLGQTSSLMTTQLANALSELERELRPMPAERGQLAPVRGAVAQTTPGIGIQSLAWWPDAA